MYFLSEYGLYLAKITTIVIAILILAAGITAILARTKDKQKGKLTITHLNEKYQQFEHTINQVTSSKQDLKKIKKLIKTRLRDQAKKKNQPLNRIFVLNFEGDIKASAVESLRQEITAILLTKKPNDEVVLRLESPGGMVHGYGLATSQLQRIKDAQLKLTIIVDKIAASGGYMMAAVADHIIAAPFAIIGSIGVIAQLPNFHRWLENRNIDFEQIMAGKYKRTLSIFGKNTSEGRKKMQQEVDDMHDLFKEHIDQHREKIDVDKIATGEYWHGVRALELNLVDELSTSDEYLLRAKDHYDLYEVKYLTKKPLTKRISESSGIALSKFFNLKFL